MQVILKKNIDNIFLVFQYEEIKVKPGFARTYLISMVYAGSEKNQLQEITKATF